jgi:hypothetical protein
MLTVAVLRAPVRFPARLIFRPLSPIHTIIAVARGGFIGRKDGLAVAFFYRASRQST